MAPTTRRCPTCQQPYTPVANSPYRPFCSERCRLIDLGDWLSERHRIAGEDLGVDPTAEVTPHETL